MMILSMVKSYQYWVIDMKSKTTVHGAVSIVNALATGKGSALGISLETTAEVLLTTENNIEITKLSATKFRVFIGPFDDLNSLKEQFNAINTLQFENIEIIKK